MIATRHLWRRLGRSRSGLAMTEMALALPILLTAGLWGTEEANLAITHMRVNQLAIQIADNASRIGDTSALQNRKIYEADINDIFVGAGIQGGAAIDLFERGRVIVSSLQVNPVTGNQYISWQRCMGAKRHGSSFGLPGDGVRGTLDGIGPAGAKVRAIAGSAVIFVEIAYDYEPLIAMPLTRDHKINVTASFMVRDDRDLTQIYQRDTTSPDPIATCNVYNAVVAT